MAFLSKQKILKLNGLEENIRQILNSLSCQTVPTLDCSKYMLFLTSKGRILFDSFIHKKNSKYYIEVDKENESCFLNHLKKYDPREKIVIQQEPSLCALWSSAATGMTSMDNRPFMGYRGLGVNNEAMKDVSSEYLSIRLQYGIAEGQEISNCLPFEVNMDKLKASKFYFIKLIFKKDVI